MKKKKEGNIMTLTPTQEKIVRILNERMVSTDTLIEALGKGYTEQKVQSMVLTLARKGLVDKTKAALLLRGTEMAKFLKYDISTVCVGRPKQKVR